MAAYNHLQYLTIHAKLASSMCFDTAQNVQIMIDKIKEGSMDIPPTIKDYIIYQLEEKLKTFPAEDVERATNIDRRIELDKISQKQQNSIR